MDRKNILKDYIKTEFLRDPNANLDESEDLLMSGVLDSLGILNLVAYIEENFNIRIPDEDVVYDNFKSIQSLDEYLLNHNM